MVFFLLVTGVLLFSVAVRTSVYGGMEQLVARKVHTLEVTGSSPVSATMRKNLKLVLFGIVVVLFQTRQLQK